MLWHCLEHSILMLPRHYLITMWQHLNTVAPQGEKLQKQYTTVGITHSNSLLGWCTTTTRQTLSYCNSSSQTLASKQVQLFSKQYCNAWCWLVYVGLSHTQCTHTCVHVGSPMKMLGQTLFSLVNLKNIIFKTTLQWETYNMTTTFFTYFAISKN